MSKHGDLAPRRPKLQTFFSASVSIENQSVSREMIHSDMRVIAGYLRSVLGQSMYHFAPLYSFLEIPSSLLSQSGSNSQTEISFGINRSEDETMHGKEPADSTLAGLSSSPQEGNQIPPVNEVELARNRSGNPYEGQSVESLKDQWRKVFVNLRRGLKPHEVAVSSPLSSSQIFFSLHISLQFPLGSLSSIWRCN